MQFSFLFKSCKKKLVLCKCLKPNNLCSGGKVLYQGFMGKKYIRENFLCRFSNKGKNWIYPGGSMLKS